MVVALGREDGIPSMAMHFVSVQAVKDSILGTVLTSLERGMIHSRIPQ